MMLVFHPETLEQMQARFARAVAFVHEPRLLELGIQLVPSARREHVFDFASGLRLVISKDRFGDRPCIHVSASACVGTPFHKYLSRYTRKPRKGLLLLSQEVLRAYGRICQQPVKLTLIAVSEGKGVPHYIAEDLQPGERNHVRIHGQAMRDLR